MNSDGLRFKLNVGKLYFTRGSDSAIVDGFIKKTFEIDNFLFIKKETKLFTCTALVHKKN